jgi:hypothetical protein
MSKEKKGYRKQRGCVLCEEETGQEEGKSSFKAYGDRVVGYKIPSKKLELAPNQHEFEI